MSESLPCLKGEPTGGFVFPTAPAGRAGPALQSAALSGRADRVVRPYKPIRRGRCLHRPAHRTTNNASVGAGGCSPSCPRIGWHFLETGSLLPPLTVLRRFPRLREGQSPSPTHSLLRFRRAGCPTSPPGHAPYFLQPVIAKPVRTLAVAIRTLRAR